MGGPGQVHDRDLPGGQGHRLREARRGDRVLHGDRLGHVARQLHGRGRRSEGVRHEADEEFPALVVDHEGRRIALAGVQVAVGGAAQDAAAEAERRAGRAAEVGEVAAFRGLVRHAVSARGGGGAPADVVAQAIAGAGEGTGREAERLAGGGGQVGPIADLEGLIAQVVPADRGRRATRGVQGALGAARQRARFQADRLAGQAGRDAAVAGFRGLVDDRIAAVGHARQRLQSLKRQSRGMRIAAPASVGLLASAQVRDDGRDLVAERGHRRQGERGERRLHHLVGAGRTKAPVGVAAAADVSRRGVHLGREEEAAAMRRQGEERVARAEQVALRSAVARRDAGPTAVGILGAKERSERRAQQGPVDARLRRQRDQSEGGVKGVRGESRNQAPAVAGVGVGDQLGDQRADRTSLYGEAEDPPGAVVRVLDRLAPEEVCRRGPRGRGLPHGPQGTQRLAGHVGAPHLGARPAAVRRLAAGQVRHAGVDGLSAARHGPGE